MVARTESSIEKAVVDYAREHGVVSIKLTTQGPRGAAGWPDRLFLGKDMQIRWIEFKTEDGALTELQKRRHMELSALGWSTAVVRDVATGKAIIDNMRLYPLKPDKRQRTLGF